MPTQAEYERQHSQTDGEEADDSADGSDDGDRTPADVIGTGGTAAGGAAAGAALPMDPRDLAKIIAVALVLWVAYRALTGGADGGAETSDLDEDGGDDQDELGGGLVG